MEKDEMLRKVKEDEDFVHAPKFGNSLQKVLAKIENPLHDNAIGRLLLISPEEVEKIYQESIIELRKEMTDEEGQDQDQGRED